MHNNMMLNVHCYNVGNLHNSKHVHHMIIMTDDDDDDVILSHMILS